MNRNAILAALCVGAAVAAIGIVSWLLPDTEVTALLALPKEDARRVESRPLDHPATRETIELPGVAPLTPEPGASEYLLEIRTRSPDGPALSGVSLTFIDEPRVVDLGETNENGSLKVRLDEFPSSVGSGYLCATRDGYELREVTVSASMAESHSVAIVMGREVVLSGQVVDWSGTPVGDGVRVAAWGNGAPPRVRAVVRALYGHATQIVGITDSAGQFVLPRLAGHEQYTLVAAGAGWVSVEPVRIVPGEYTDAPLSIVASALYGAEARVIDSSTGQPVEINTRMSCGPPYSGRVLLDHEAVEIWDQRVLTLAGVTGDGAGMSRSFTGPFFVRKDAVEERVGPLGLSLNLAGYERGGGRIWLERIHDSLPVVEVELQPSSAHRETGLLTVRITNADSLTISTIIRDTSFATMTLTPRDSQQTPISASLRPIFGKDQEIGQVPCGDYTVGVEFYTNLTLPSEECPIGVLSITGDGGRVDLDISRLPQANIDLQRDGEAVSYRGPIQLSLVRDGPNLTDRVVITCQGPPYYLPPLLPGRYHAQARLCDPLDPAYEQKVPRGETRLVEIPHGDAPSRSILLEAW